MYGVTTITTKGQIVIPESIRTALKLTPSTRIHVELKGSEIVARPILSTTQMMGIANNGQTHTDAEIEKAIKKGLSRKFKRT